MATNGLDEYWVPEHVKDYLRKYSGYLDLDLFYGTHDDWRRLCAVAGASAGTKEEDVVSISRANVAAQIMEHLCSCRCTGIANRDATGPPGIATLAPTQAPSR